MSRRPASRDASLGCGSLILIAIIVMIFSGNNRISDVDSRMNEMQNEIRNVNAALQRIERRLEAIETKLGPQTTPTDDAKDK